MKKFFSSIRNNKIARTISYWCVLVFFCLYTFSIPTFSSTPRFYLISYVFVALFIAVVGLHILLFEKFKFNKYFICPLAFTLFALVGTVLFSKEFRHWITLVLLFITALTFYYAFTIIKNKRLIFKLLLFALLAFSFCYIAIYIPKMINIIKMLLKGKLVEEGLGTDFDNVNAVGFYFSLGFSVAIYLSLFPKKKIELLYLIPLFVFFVCGFFTASRAFLVSIALITLFVTFLKLKKHPFIFLGVMISLIAAAIVLINLPFFASFKDSFGRMAYTLFGVGDSKPDTATVQRYEWPQYAFYLAGKNLLFGYGAFGFATASGIGTYSHNNFSEVFCNFGVMGFVLFQLSFLIPFFLSLKPKDKDVIMVQILVAIFMIRNVFAATYYTKETYLILGLCLYLTKDCAVPVISFKRKKRRIESEMYEVFI